MVSDWSVGRQLTNEKTPSDGHSANSIPDKTGQWTNQKQSTKSTDQW